MSYQQQGYNVPPRQEGYSPQSQHQEGGRQPQPPQQQLVQEPVNYSSTAQMNVENVSKERVVFEGSPKEWRFGLFDCFADFGLCQKTSEYPCVTYGENKARLNANMGSCTGNCLLYCCLNGCCCLGWILGAMHRNEMRNKYKIDGTALGDCFTHFCFNSCALIQESREANASHVKRRS